MRMTVNRRECFKAMLFAIGITGLMAEPNEGPYWIPVFVLCKAIAVAAFYALSLCDRRRGSDSKISENKT